MIGQIEYEFNQLGIGARFCVPGNSCVFHKTSESTAEGGVLRVTHNFPARFIVVRASSVGTITEAPFLKEKE